MILCKKLAKLRDAIITTFPNWVAERSCDLNPLGDSFNSRLWFR